MPFLFYLWFFFSQIVLNILVLYKKLLLRMCQKIKIEHIEKRAYLMAAEMKMTAFQGMDTEILGGSRRNEETVALRFFFSSTSLTGFLRVTLCPNLAFGRKSQVDSRFICTFLHSFTYERFCSLILSLFIFFSFHGKIIIIIIQNASKWEKINPSSKQ